MSFHVAIIMDGNGRWATERGLPRIAGHREGASAVRRVVEAAPDLGIDTLTLYAFSEDNWRRPQREVSALMRLLSRYLVQETDRCIRNGVRLQAIGRRDRLGAPLLALLEQAEEATREGRTLHLRLAIDYSSRSAILNAVNHLNAGNQLNIEKQAWNRPEPAHRVSPAPLTEARLTAALGPDVDLLIRTSGEQRLSDFLLWECAYAEMIFTARMWPAFTSEDLAAAVKEFHGRSRRFGAVEAQTARTA